MNCIAGVGARKTPNNILTLMTAIGAWCRSMGIWVRSGHADGADLAFEKGAEDFTIVYMPWAGFNWNKKFHSPNVIMPSDVSAEAATRAQQSVRDYHPNASRLSSVAFGFMVRNYYQIMGTKPEPKPVDAVVCWTPKGSGSGGTGQAIRLANAHNTPVLDLGKPMP